MSHKEVLYGWFILITLAFVTVLFLSEPLPTPTGYAVSLLANPEVSAEKIWDCSNSSEYTYNSSAISLNGTAQLMLIVTTTSTIINETNESSLLFATEYEDGDTANRTNKVNSLGSGNVQLDDGKIVLEVILDTQLQNNDLLSLYILSGTDASGRIYVCNDSSGCGSSEYGSLSLPSSISAGWYNLTLSGMSSATNTLFIDSPDKIKIDMVKGYKKSNRTEITMTNSYPLSSSIETADFQPSNWKSWGVLSKVEQLNGQTTHYYYSTNSGSTWTAVSANLNVSTVAGNTVRFKIELNSNTTSTPVVDALSIVYSTQQPCTESWDTQYGSCLKNDTKLKYYTDSNECGTVSLLPVDNNTYASCDYCDLFNCSKSLIQQPVMETRGNRTIYVVDAVNTVNLKLEIDAAGNSNVEMMSYSYNIKNATPSSTAVNRYVDIESTAPNITSVTIMLYYNVTDIVTLDENTLKIYYYNETSAVWDDLTSTVNVSGDYVSAVVPHMSLYGLFGEAFSSTTESTSGGGGGGRRNAEITAPISKDVVETAETILPTRSESTSTIELNAPISETSCDYVIEISLPDQITLGNNNSYEGEIINKGNCEIPFLKVELSPALRDKVTIPVSYFESISPGNKTNFVLIRTQHNNDGFFGATSYVVGNLREETISGFMMVEGQDEQQAVFTRELPLEVVFEPTFPWKELASLSIIVMTLVVIFGGLIMNKKKQKKRRSKNLSKRQRIHF